MREEKKQVKAIDIDLLSMLLGLSGTILLFATLFMSVIADERILILFTLSLIFKEMGEKVDVIKVKKQTIEKNDQLINHYKAEIKRIEGINRVYKEEFEKWKIPSKNHGI